MLWTTKREKADNLIGLTCYITYSSAWSKNKMWRASKGNARVYIAPESKRLKRTLAQLIAAERLSWREQKKLFVFIRVYRSNMRCDVQNFIDLICDAVRDGTGVGDNYFSGAWDWELVNKGREMITIYIYQHGEEG